MITPPAVYAKGEFCAGGTAVRYVWYGLIYSVAGFFLEVAFARVTRASKQDRKCHLFLPVCPVYGLGAVAILLLPEAILTRPLLLAPAAVIAATAAEYLMSLFYQYVWKVSFWDYSTLPLNLNGRVCLLFSAFWGALAFPLVYVLHPWVEQTVALLPNGLLLPVLMVLAVDGVLTGHLLRQGRDTRVLIWYQ